MMKLSILAWLDLNAKLISLSGNLEKIYIMDISGVASILHRDMLILEKEVNREIWIFKYFKMLPVKHDRMKAVLELIWKVSMNIQKAIKNCILNLEI